MTPESAKEPWLLRAIDYLTFNAPGNLESKFLAVAFWCFALALAARLLGMNLP